LSRCGTSDREINVSVDRLVAALNALGSWRALSLITASILYAFWLAVAILITARQRAQQQQT
jgi:hypothetical protein